MSEVILRDYRAGDWEAMHALDLTCFQPPFRFSRRTMRNFAEARNAIVLLAEIDQTMVGFCVAHVEQQVAYVVTLDVSPELRRRGIAARLMEETEARARALAAVSLALHVSTENTGAIRFYEALGCQQVGMAESFYGRALNAFVYSKSLRDAGPKAGCR